MSRFGAADSREDQIARARLRAIPDTNLSDSYIAILPIEAVYELLSKHERGGWPPDPFAFVYAL